MGTRSRSVPNPETYCPVRSTLADEGLGDCVQTFIRGGSRSIRRHAKHKLRSQVKKILRLDESRRTQGQKDLLTLPGIYSL